MRAKSPYVNADGPLAYFITFPTYGTWLHGDQRGSVDRDHNTPGTPMLAPNDRRRSNEQRRLANAPIRLNRRAREIVHRTIDQVAAHRGWTLHAVNVRSNHVHVVISGCHPVERIMNDLKAWATRRLVEGGLFAKGTRLWVRHGSTRYLWNPEEVESASRYVAEGQGEDSSSGEMSA